MTGGDYGSCVHSRCVNKSGLSFVYVRFYPRRNKGWEMLELSEIVAGVEVVPLCNPLVGNELTYVTGEV